MSKKVAILGSGPAAIYAAQACFENNVECTIYTTHPVWLSPMLPAGAFYLHEIPPSLELNGSVFLESIKECAIGDEKSYVKLQWGELANKVISSSFPKESRTVIGYAPSVLHYILPPIQSVISYNISLDTDSIYNIAEKYDLVLQTFPTTEAKKVQLPNQPFYIATYYGNDEYVIPYLQPSKNFILYRGLDYGVIVRISRLFGVISFEFPKNINLEFIKENFYVPSCKFQLCYDLHPEVQPWTKTSRPNIQLLGRMATWDRTFLAHHSYSKVCGLLKSFTICP